MKKYIHYGSSSFDINKFIPISNRKDFNKPYGGLWASPCEAPNIGWKEWCSIEDFHTDELNEHFIFSIKKDAKIYFIKTIRDVYRLQEMIVIPSPFSFCKPLNFELFQEMGYDGIEIEINNYHIYDEMYGWDVDSILIFNPDIIIEEK